MIEAYKEFFKNYTNFYGRTSRRGFWLVYLMNVLIGIGVGVIGSIIAIGLNSIEGLLIPFVLAGGYALAILIPSIAIAVRRLHDAGFSGFFYLIAFIPGVGGIALLILCLLESKPANQWGLLQRGMDNIHSLMGSPINSHMDRDMGTHSHNSHIASHMGTLNPMNNHNSRMGILMEAHSNMGQNLGTPTTKTILI